MKLINSVLLSPQFQCGSDSIERSVSASPSMRDYHANIARMPGAHFTGATPSNLN
jgi:hypothetical protein